MSWIASRNTSKAERASRLLFDSFFFFLIPKESRRPAHSWPLDQANPYPFSHKLALILSSIGSIDLLGDPVMEHPLLHPAHGQQIVERREQAVPHAVMALAGKPRIIAHRNFRDREAFQLDERRQKSVHSLEEFQVCDALAPKGPVSATRVADIFVGELVPDPVGDSRRGNAQE